MDLTRRSFLKGIGAVSVTLLFKRKLDAVLNSLEEELVAELPTNLAQLPTAADIVVVPQIAFRASRIVVAPPIANLFIIENIVVGERSQLVHEIPAAIFQPNAFDAGIRMDTASSTHPLRFRVRYVGDSKDGAKFYGAIFGESLIQDEQQRYLPRMMVLPLESIQLGA